MFYIFVSFFNVGLIEDIFCEWFFKKIFIQFLKVILHLQLLQNTGYIPHVEQYILVAYLKGP